MPVRPVLSLAPMQDVSVLPLWRCLSRRGGPDLYVTEYLRVHRDSVPEKAVLASIRGMSGRAPVVAQMIGNDPEHLVRTAKFVQENSDCAGIDVNLGCPAPKVCGKLAGGALLKNKDLIRRIAVDLRSVVAGSLTLKTRVGFESEGEFDELLELFAELPIDGLAVHGRTVRERYQSAVHTECIARAVGRLPFPVTANGSIVSAAAASGMLARTGAAGLMIGRGGIRNPWLFEQIRAEGSGELSPRPRLRDVLDYILELTKEVDREGNFHGPAQLVHRMKKFTNYIASGLGGGALNERLRRATTRQEFESACRDGLSSDDPFPEEPVEDRKLFCGFRDLVEAKVPVV
ncbi:MAG: tRNA-dihydrouridine synthase family protein [Verrucomicrobiales bacterium]